jgi:uncharacterized membrane protein
MSILSHLTFFNVTLSIIMIIHFADAIANISFPNQVRKLAREDSTKNDGYFFVAGVGHLILTVAVIYIIINFGSA